MDGWYYEAEDGERRGPLSLEQIRALASPPAASAARPASGAPAPPTAT